MASYPPPPPPSSRPPHANHEHPQAPPPPRSKEASKQISRQERAHHRSRVQNSGVKIETEEERRLRKKRELRHKMKNSHKPSVVEKKPTSLLTTEKVENRLKKPTTFMCKFKFRNELPDPTAPLKLMTIKPDKDQHTKYSITSLEKLWKPRIFAEPDLGVPLDLLDLSVYNPPEVRAHLAPEDEALLRDDDAVTPIKNNGIRRKERPTDLGVSWLVKTQYISSINNESTRQSLTEKQAKELREGIDILSNLDNREKQIKDIEASFAACKSQPVHATKKDLHPVEILPLMPYFDRYDEQFVIANFDSAPTADSEVFSKLNPSTRDEYESQAILKSYVVAGSDTVNPDQFLAYMVPSLDETSKDYMHDENEDVPYTWVREYHWDHVRGDDTYLVSFDDGTARYLPLPSKLNLKKKRAREGRSSDEIEHFPVPSKVTVRRIGASGSKMRRLEDKDANQYSDGYSE